jgi:serine/threonine protein kinase
MSYQSEYGNNYGSNGRESILDIGKDMMLEPKLKYEFSNITRLVKSLNMMNSNYSILKTVHTTNKKGSYVITNATGKKFFLKAKLKDFVSKNELEIYKKIKKYSHKNINKINAIYETSSFILVISEFLEGFDMSDSRYAKIYENDLNNIFVQSLDGLFHLHSIGISHCDIKPANIMINTSSKTYFPVIIDFDLARFIDDCIVNKSYGSTGFISPEVHCGQINSKTDEWSLAMSFYLHIFKDILSKKDFREIETSEYSDVSFMNVSFLKDYTGKYRQLVSEIAKMLNTDPQERPDISLIISRIKRSS